MTASLPADTHTHTALCRHAGGLPLDYARAAAARGITEMACTEHIPFPNDPAPAIRMTMAEFPRYLELVREAQQAGLCRVLLGLEADYQRELIAEHIPRLLDAADFDLVLGSIHTGPFWDLAPDDPAATPAFISQMNRTYYQRLTAMAQTGLYDVCAHFDLVKRAGIHAPLAELAEMVPPALDAVAAAGMAIEINTSGFRHRAGEAYPSLAILGWMKERQIPIVFGSDAHNPNDVGQQFPQAMALARAAGHTHYAAFRQRRFTLRPF